MRNLSLFAASRSIFSALCVGLAIVANLSAARSSDLFSSSDPNFVVPSASDVDDSLAPTPLQLRAAADWAKAAFAGGEFAPVADGFSIRVVRQDYNKLHYDQSCLGTPLCVANVLFDKGLGTHANSEILFSFEKPIVRFSASAGVDSNRTTSGGLGSVVFVVRVDGEEVARSPIMKSDEKAFAFELEFPNGATTLTLCAESTEDGPNCDQADWIEPVASAEDGTVYNLSEVVDIPLAAKVPFSFVYDGKPSSELLPTWDFEYRDVDALRSTATWRDPATELRVVATIRRFSRFAALDWILTFENASDKETPLLEKVRVADVDFNCVDVATPEVRTLTGDSCSENSWLPIAFPLKKGESKQFAPVGGRSSNGAFPFWNVRETNAIDDAALGQGVFFALGWSGQWASEFNRATANRLNFSAGQETLATVLLPGETIRTPRALAVPWKSDLASAHALFRRLLLFEYAPKDLNGLPQSLGAVGQCFDRYYRKRPGWEKIDGQLEYARRLKAAGCDAHWFDAAWFPKGFPNGVGSWYSDPESFPNGVEELGDALRKLDMNFVLWFEPERVAKDSQFANEYPQYVFGGKEGGLFKLNEPEARRFLTDLLARRVREFGVDVFRTDFNIDPAPYWKENDAPNRIGITEIRYVEGLYEYWDELRATFPGLWIDDCASGGRRIDLETISRSIPLWRSDTCCWPDHPEWDQSQTLGLASYLPLYSCCAWDPSPYVFRSAANPGVLVQYDFFNENYDAELAEPARRSIEEGKIYRKFWRGDFYPLTDASVGKKSIAAWQLHRPDWDAGLVYVFRQTESPYTGCEFSLRGIDPDATYEVRYKYDYDVQETKSLKGNELIALPAPLPNKRTALVVEYEKTAP